MKAFTGALLAALVVAVPASAQEFPSKTIRIITPYQAGGITDMAARLISQRLQDEWKQPVVIENRPGAGGTLAVRAAAEADPDGYTWLMTTTSEFTINPSVYKQIPYELARDFNPITMIAESPLAIVAPPQSPFSSTSELAAFLKQQTAPLQYASPGNGSLNHLLAEWLADSLNAKFQQITYKGGAPATTAVISGEVQLGVLSLAVSRSQAESGKLKIVAISSPQRSQLAPALPTLKESNIPISATIWVGLFTPKNVPAAINEKIHAMVVKILDEAPVRASFLAQGTEVKFMPSAEFTKQIATEEAQYRTIARKANILAQ